MLNVFVVGCNGRMGKLVCELIRKSDDMKVVGGYDCKHGPGIDDPDIEVSDHIIDLENVDVIIDFSRPSATMKAIEVAVEYNVPIVIATTGFTAEQEAIIEEAAKTIPIFKSSNMSFGVYILNQLVAYAAEALSDYDPEIHEIHHRMKADSPSGTAKMLADTIAEHRYVSRISYGRTDKRFTDEVGISSNRGGNVAGDHTVYFFGNNDTITISHHADNPSIFAEGAIKCAAFIANKDDPQIYTMDDYFCNMDDLFDY